MFEVGDGVYIIVGLCYNIEGYIIEGTIATIDSMLYDIEFKGGEHQRIFVSFDEIIGSTDV